MRFCSSGPRHSSIRKLEAVLSSETTLHLYQATRRQILEGSVIHRHCFEHLKFNKFRSRIILYGAVSLIEPPSWTLFYEKSRFTQVCSWSTYGSPLEAKLWQISSGFKFYKRLVMFYVALAHREILISWLLSKFKSSRNSFECSEFSLILRCITLFISGTNLPKGGVSSLGGGKNFLFFMSPNRPRGPPSLLSSCYRGLSREADGLPATSAQVKNTWIYTSAPSRGFMS